MFKQHGLNTCVIPSGGWCYQQPYKDGFQRIPVKGCAGTAERLLEQVKVFRARAHIDMGDPERDIAAYIKKESPMNNRFPSRAEREAPVVRHRPIIERIRDHLLSLSDHAVRLIFPDEAHKRMDVCSGCPQNVKWKTGCVPCCNEIKERGQNLRRLPSDESDKLGACRLHGFYLPAIIFVDRDELKEHDPRAPAACWMKTEKATFDNIEDSHYEHQDSLPADRA